MSASNRVIQGFWQGPFTTMERLCVESFMQNGHEFHLYCYEKPEGVPEGVVVKDAREIVPESQVSTFRCSTHFSDFFRVNLLLKRGGFHSDMDNICLRPMEASQQIMFSIAITTSPRFRSLFRSAPLVVL